jgi:protoporphyrinogen oxidase
LQIHTLWELIRSLLVKPSAVETKFLYARRGTGTYSEKLAERIRAAGGRVEVGARVEAVYAEGGAVTGVRAAGRDYRADRVIWTAPLTVLAELLGEPSGGAPELRYLDIVFYNLVTTSRCGPSFQWCYFGEKPIPFNRVSRPEDFDPDIIPEGRHGLCVEVSAPPGHPAWTEPEAQLPGILRGLVDVGLLRAESDVHGVHIERVTECYPIYTAGYRAPLKALKERLGRYRNVVLAGRTGMYWYNNMDHSIGLAMKIAKDELAGRGAAAEAAPGMDPPLR